MTTTITAALNSEKYNLVNQLETIVELVGAGAEMEQFGVDAAPFPYEEEAELTEIAEEAYEESYGYAPAREVNCCSLQLGMLIQAADLECVSIGTDIEGIHSPAEKMNLESVGHTWDFIQVLMGKLSTR
jgi:dipeptidase D